MTRYKITYELIKYVEAKDQDEAIIYGMTSIDQSMMHVTSITQVPDGKSYKQRKTNK